MNVAARHEYKSTFLLVSVKFHCPGCNMQHAVYVQGDSVPVWTWNNLLDKPTFSPSIRRQGPQRDAAGNFTCGSEGVCHSFVRDGMIEFLGDCTHALKNQTVPLPAMPSDAQSPLPN